MNSPPERSSERLVAVWLLACCVMVLIIMAIGAITRLSDSGLSMVEWRPLLGLLPPLTDKEWLRIFTLYQQTPEYRLLNLGLTLAGFQHIFWWEWVHRVWGRLIGLAFLVPMLGFWLSGVLSRCSHPRRLLLRLWGLFSLTVLQGLAGWWLVESGMAERPSVSHYRLALHLMLATTLLLLTLAQALQLLSPHPRKASLPCPTRQTIPRSKALTGWLWACLLALSLNMIWGAFTAGLDAGQVYNSFPLMGDHWFPPEAHSLSPWWTNLTDNPATVQWIHRWLGVATALLITSLWWQVIMFARSLVIYAHLLILGVWLQVVLGIIVLVFGVPVIPAVAHQLNAVALLALLVSMLMRHRPG